MKNNKSHLKSARILICLLLLFFFNNSLYSQIIYTDIPDVTPNATYALDLNNDSTADFLLQFEQIDKVMCIPQNNNAYSGELTTGMYLPWALSNNTFICDTLATWFYSNNSGIMAWGTTIGNWDGQSDKYLALKLIDGSNTYFGWARLTFNATSTSFTIKDYAYESTPNTCIRSGQSALSIHENSTKPIISIYPNPFISSTSIQILSDSKNVSLTIYNVYGQIVKQINNISSSTFELYRENFTSGFYFIKLTTENKIWSTTKLIVTD